ncbi:amino acid permease [Allosaccharopolyspora coralli]|uniref:Amino acid permease n=1 Tax=Allosaccharopolyspora coralli TaxID=2665642 RepID=A0A5Q3Q1Z3_9PSEU|nr:APC family permease [Allosaccharopolyspora coralli]QGK68598.1 amino acid permease [Allosaccharopolyspora coralli]
MANETTVSPDASGGPENPGLKRVMGPKLLLFFVIGDILGTTIYSLTGKVAGKVGGALWVPFLVAFVVAFLTAFSYLELVGKYPKAGGAPLYVHRAFGIHFLTFLIAFAVMSSGITSAASAAQAFSGDYMEEVIGTGVPSWGIAIGFVLLLAAINLRGVSESVKMNIVLTCIELGGLAIVIATGLFALFGGSSNPDVTPDPSRLLEFNPDSSPLLAITSATALAFFAMVGFEDSVNMAEETKDPAKTFPRALLLGLGVTALIYLVIAVITSTLVPTDELAASDGPLLLVVQAAAPWFPAVLFSAIALFAVTNTALINMLMASRLLYGMANEKIIPKQFGSVYRKRQTPWVSILFTSIIAIALVSTLEIENLGSTTSLLLLTVFAVVNVAVLVLRKEKVEHEHFRAPTWVPVLGAITCAFFASPFSGRPATEYVIMGLLLGVGVLFWVVNYFVTGRTRFNAESLQK